MKSICSVIPIITTVVCRCDWKSLTTFNIKIKNKYGDATREMKLVFCNFARTIPHIHVI